MEEENLNLTCKVRMTKTRKIKKIKHIALDPGPYQCHPKIGQVRPTEGCLPPDILEKIGATQNKKEPIHEWTFLHNSTLSDEEKSKLAKEYLRPKQPDAWKDDPDMWLDSSNIEDVMKQYEEAFPDFEFMGPYPIDFAAPDPYTKNGPKKCLMNEVCELKVLEAMDNGTKTNRIGIIYNLDPHFKGGSHWIGLYIDILKHKCYYFDSYGMFPPKQIARFMKWLTVQDPKMKLMYNGRRFQHKNTECGMYSLYFIIRMIHGDGFRSFTRQSPPDSEMLKLRHWIFST
jgi:hypothetical protein